MAVVRSQSEVPGLDKLIDGGFPRRPNTYLIKGPPKSGKTTLASQIQWASIQRGEPCLFITYADTFSTVISQFLNFGWDVSEYMEQGNFGILDNATILTGVDIEEVKALMSETERRGVAFVDPRDPEQYFLTQIGIMERLGMREGNAGVNVIDSADIRFRFFDGPAHRLPEEVMQYFNKFRNRFALWGQIGLHLLNPVIGEERFGQMLEDIEDGLIELDLREEEGELRRYLRVVGMPLTNHDRRWHLFTITDGGIRILD